MSTMEDAVTFPWMDGEYFKSILTKYEGRDDLQLREFNVKSGTKKGENFASAIFRVTLSYLLDDDDEKKPKETTFIIKTSSESSAISEMLEEMGTFAGEANVYSNIIPECENLFQNFKIAPRLVHVDNNAMVLNDLLRDEFKLADRKIRFDLSRAKIVVKKLAKFHAATAVIHKRNSKLMEPYLNSAINSVEDTPITFFFTVSMQETLETIRRSPELKSYIKHLEDFDIVGEEKKVFARSADDKFHVLNHGDLWINNIFFSFDGAGSPIDTMLVDYQECFFGSPGIDLNHFLFTSCSVDVLLNHTHELIEFYHRHLSAALNELAFANIPTLKDIQDEVARKANQGLVALCSIVPVMMIENPEHASVENFITDDEGAAEIRREVYGNPKFVQLLSTLLPILCDKK